MIITAREYRKNHQGKPAFIETFNGRKKITLINKNYDAFQPVGERSQVWSLHAQSKIEIEDE